MQILSCSIDLTKINKSKIRPHANGSKYYNISVMVNDEKDSFGNNVAITEGQSKEERDAKEKKVYIGNGKTVFEVVRTPKEPETTNTQSDSLPPSENLSTPPEIDNLPF